MLCCVVLWIMLLHDNVCVWWLVVVIITCDYGEDDKMHARQEKFIMVDQRISA